MPLPANQGMKLQPKDHAEAVALFRAQLLGPVLCTELHRGELLAELRVLAKRRYLPPGSDTTRRYSVPTLLRWRRLYCKNGLEGAATAFPATGGRPAVDR